MAGEDAGTLTAEGAALLDPTGKLQPGKVAVKDVYTNEFNPFAKGAAT